MKPSLTLGVADYDKALYLLQGTDISMYLIVGIVVCTLAIYLKPGLRT
jgi:hypothetical protein